MNIYYLGPTGSYSEILAKKEFSDQTRISVSSFEHVGEAVLKNKDAIGILGIENSSSSSVHTNVDMIFNTKLFIIGEATMNIRLHLIGPKGTKIEDVKEVYSHPQALAQCTEFIQKHSFIARPIESTTAAVKLIADKNDKNIAAIASLQSVKHDLEIIQENIANHQNNMTRWVFVSRIQNSTINHANKLTVIFTVKHEPGSLVNVLQKISDAQGNLTRIESRPVPGSDWEYQFWIDVEIPEGSIETFENILKKVTHRYRMVGAYKRGTFYTK